MNDSFLEDLELVSSDVKNVNAHSVNRHITTRTATSFPLQHISKNKRGNVKLNENIEPPALPEKSALKETKDSKTTSQQDIRKLQTKVRIVDSKLKSIENKVKHYEKQKKMKNDAKVKIRESKIKSTENKAIIMSSTQHSGSHTKNTETLDIKENSRPGSSKGETSPEEAITDACKIHEDEKSENTNFAMLNAIQQIVNEHVKQESTKMLRVLQSLHYKSQATVIKHLLLQTDDIIAELRSSNNLSGMKILTELNEKLRENNMTLQKRNEELQKQLGELEHLKEENIALKLKLSKQ